MALANKKSTTTKQPATKPVAKKLVPKPAAKRAAKTPIAFLRKLEASLDHMDVAPQCEALAKELGALGAPRDGIAATALLAHTRKGTPVARAYLRVLAGEPAAADEIVRHCATMTLGRSAMRGAFVAAWPKATDVAALEAAFTNFGKAIVEDPRLLAAGVEAARRLGNVGALGDRSAALERATRLAPLVAELAGAAPARARAAKQLAALGPVDRRHVHGRVIDEPRAYDEALGIAAVLALADDPQIADMSIAAAVTRLRHRGQTEIVAAWKARVADGDGALIMRLLGLFESTALRATDDDQLEPYIHALWPASGQPDVFSHIEHAIASPNAVVRAAVCEGWVREAEGRGAFDDAQIDKLVRSVVAIAEAGEQTDDQRAANSALFYVSHPGARQALINAIRHASTKHNDELRNNCYRGLSHIDHPDVWPFFIERMFGEREEYWALLGSIGERLDTAGHRTTLAELVRRASEPDAIHAATAYAEVLVSKKPSPRLLVELGRAILAWQPPSNDDARRLRYVFEQAALGALAIRSPDDARAFATRAKALPAAPYSDYHVVDRGNKTPAAFAQAEVKAQLAALEAGKLDREIATARAAADAARAAKTPVAADDTRLGALTGCTVASRFLDDRERKIVWFFDEVGELHVYDGYSVVPMVLEVAGVEGRTYTWRDDVAALVDGQTLIDERVTFADAKVTAVRDVIRIGSRLLVFDGKGLDFWKQIGVALVGLRFASYAAARDAIAQFVANPPEGMSRIDSWYREGSGAIRRAYYTPLTGGRYNSDGKAELAILGGTIDGRRDDGVAPIDRSHADTAAASNVLQAWEGKLFAASGRITKIWLDASTTRREDTLLATYLDDRYRTDTESAAWHLRGLADMMAAIDEAGLRPLVPEIDVKLGPPATDAELAAYQAIVPAPLPAELVELWREVGGGGFTTTSTSARFLAPAEIIANRAAHRDRIRSWAPGRFKGRALKTLLASIDHLDVIATLDGEPLILFDTRQLEDGCFASAEHVSWMTELNWQIATDINALLKRELERRVGDVFRLRLGTRAGAATRRARLTKADKEYEAIVDGAQLLTRTLTAKSAGKPSVKQLASADAAAAAFDAAVAAAKKKGFR